MGDLSEFVRERLAEDEAAAKAAAGEYDATWEPVKMLGRDTTRVVDLAGFPVSPGGIDAVGEHIARHDPARALREVVAKRAILAEHTTWEVLYGAEHPEIRQPCCLGCGNDNGEEPRSATLDDCPTIRALATAWDDHPDYDRAWAPVAVG